MTDFFMDTFDYRPALLKPVLYDEANQFRLKCFSIVLFSVLFTFN